MKTILGVLFLLGGGWLVFAVAGWLAEIIPLWMSIPTLALLIVCAVCNEVQKNKGNR